MPDARDRQPLPAAPRPRQGKPLSPGTIPVRLPARPQPLLQRAVDISARALSTVVKRGTVATSPALAPRGHAEARTAAVVVTGLYLVAVTFLALHHELWRDEVRALNIAAFSHSPAELFGNLRNEGHPPLWYLLLFAGHRLTGSMLVIKPIAVLIAAAGAYVLVRFAPFPTWQKVLFLAGEWHAQRRAGAVLATDEGVAAPRPGGLHEGRFLLKVKFTTDSAAEVATPATRTSSFINSGDRVEQHTVVGKHPVTQAVRALRAARVAFDPFLYPWHARGGTRDSAEALGVDEHQVVKTLIFETDDGSPLCVLMHGDREVSAKGLARLLRAKSTAPCSPPVAERHSGYLVGGTSPFGLRRAMPVYMQHSILELPLVYINGGARGFLVAIKPEEARRVLVPTLVDVAI